MASCDNKLVRFLGIFLAEKDNRNFIKNLIKYILLYIYKYIYYILLL